MNPVGWLRELWQDVRRPVRFGTVIPGALQAGETMGPFIVDCDPGGPSAGRPTTQGASEAMKALLRADRKAAAAAREDQSRGEIVSMFRGAATHSGAYLLDALAEIGWELRPSSSITDATVERVARELHAALRKPDEPTTVWSGHYLTLARRLLSVAQR